MILLNIVYLAVSGSHKTPPYKRIWLTKNGRHEND